jgi:succinate-semialdehyde dehydrogenase/glutarate-semialdehyde dehydrogenase
MTTTIPPAAQPARPLHPPTPGGARTLRVLDPADGSLVGELGAAGPPEVDAAVAAARAAAPDWARTPVTERAACLRAAADRVRQSVEDLAVLTTREMGKPLADARGGVEAGLATLVQYAELGPVHRGRSLVGAWAATDLMVHEPRGVIAVVTPWNDPVAVPAGLISAALVTGNTVVFKPSERTPHTGLALARLLAGSLPDGVLVTVTGDGSTGSALVAHPGLDMVAHVGSTATGRSIAAAAARTGAHVILENGGKDALVVDADVDPVWAAEQAALGAFANAGQICTSVERLYVLADVAGPFLQALTARATALRMGPGIDPATELGPLVDRRQRDVVHAHVTDALSRGATLLTGGQLPDGPGAFYPATVLTGARPDMLVMREETFGPIAPVSIVDTYDEALTLAADSAYGLAATVLTADPAHAQQAWRALPVGTVKINAVFGGAPGGAAQPRRASGTGFGYGPELLDEMTVTKVVHWRADPPRRPAARR